MFCPPPLTKSTPGGDYTRRHWGGSAPRASSYNREVLCFSTNGPADCRRLPGSSVASCFSSFHSKKLEKFVVLLLFLTRIWCFTSVNKTTSSILSFSMWFTCTFVYARKRKHHVHAVPFCICLQCGVCMSTVHPIGHVFLEKQFVLSHVARFTCFLYACNAVCVCLQCTPLVPYVKQ